MKVLMAGQVKSGHDDDDDDEDDGDEDCDEDVDDGFWKQNTVLLPKTMTSA